MSAAWKPGDVAIAAYDGKVMRYFRRRVFGTDFYEWASEEGSKSERFESADWHRPLAVIDPEDREQAERLAKGLPCSWNLFQSDDPDLGDDSIDAIQAALREFVTPTPPKLDEPPNFGAIVEDESGQAWSRRADKHWNGAHGDIRMWREISAVRVLSEGVTP